MIEIIHRMDKDGRILVTANFRLWKWSRKLAEATIAPVPLPLRWRLGFEHGKALETPLVTAQDSRHAAEFLASDAYRSIFKFWRYQGQALELECLRSNRTNAEFNSGRYQGFMLARDLVEQLANYSETQAEKDKMPTEEAMYSRMGRMDRGAAY